MSSIRLCGLEAGHPAAPDREVVVDLVAHMGVSAEVADLGLLAAELLSMAAAEPPASPIEPSQAEHRLVLIAAAEYAVTAFPAVRESLSRQLRDRHAEQARELAARQWEALRRQPPSQRRRMVDEVPADGAWALAERLATASVPAAASGAAAALELARLAVQAAQRSAGGEAWRNRLLGFVQAFAANALRVAGKLRDAEKAFAAARQLWRSGAAGDPAGVLPEWQLCDLEASLRTAMRAYPAALSLLKRAATLAPPSMQGRLLLHRAQVLDQSGDSQRAIAALEKAIPFVQDQSDPQARWGQGLQLVDHLCRLGAFSAAQDQLPALRARAADRGSELDLLRVLWLTGRVEAGLENQTEAAAALDQVRRTFFARRNALDAAIVSLDLAVLHLEAGRTAEVRALAEAMAWIFASEELDRKSGVALRRFCGAARQELATVDQARQVLGEIRPNGWQRACREIV